MANASVEATLDLWASSLALSAMSGIHRANISYAALRMNKKSAFSEKTFVFVGQSVRRVLQPLAIQCYYRRSAPEEDPNRPSSRNRNRR